MNWLQARSGCAAKLAPIDTGLDPLPQRNTPPPMYYPLLPFRLPQFQRPARTLRRKRLKMRQAERRRVREKLKGKRRDSRQRTRSVLFASKCSNWRVARALSTRLTAPPSPKLSELLLTLSATYFYISALLLWYSRNTKAYSGWVSSRLYIA